MATITKASLKKREYIRIYNYTSSPVCISLRERQEMIDPKNENDIAGYKDIRWNDLYYINDRTNCFRQGLLRFAEDEAEILYEELGIFNWKDILFEEDFEEIILHPTLEGLQKIIDITSISVIDRVRAVSTHIKNNGIDIPSKSTMVVDRRFKELQNGQRKSNIELSAKEVYTAADEKDVTALKDEVAELKAMVQQLTQVKA